MKQEKITNNFSLIQSELNNLEYQNEQAYIQRIAKEIQIVPEVIRLIDYSERKIYQSNFVSVNLFEFIKNLSYNEILPSVEKIIKNQEEIIINEIQKRQICLKKRAATPHYNKMKKTITGKFLTNEEHTEKMTHIWKKEKIFKQKIRKIKSQEKQQLLEKEKAKDQQILNQQELLKKKRREKSAQCILISN